MLGVAALLASSSMAAIELITLYARLGNTVHKMHHTSYTHPSPSSRISLCLIAMHKKDLCIAVEER